MTEETPEAVPEETPEAPVIPPYGLRWALKRSFVGYVARMPDGQAYLGDGAAVNEQNELVFPIDEDAPDEADRVFAFGGDVRFSGHFGLLFVQIARPHVFVRDGRAEVTVNDPASKEGKRLLLATCTLTGPVDEDGLDRWEATDVRLAAPAVELFGDSYQAGEPFEPLVITAPRSGGPEN